ncbi:Ornithine aminotransferase 2 [bioreactor metagenome]|uniref:Ornithine aminotransferase 2 n=1 Tax=bioreactor metagenome TaxID=1076179 RepID=A0A645ESK1_9ZZZZ
MSAVLSNNDIMEVFRPGQHGSTFGGNPLAAAVAVAALRVVSEENLINNAYESGAYFRNEMEELRKTSKIVQQVRGKGLLNALVIDNEGHENLAWDICMKLAENGLLAKPTHTNIIRFAPPLVITREELRNCIEIIRSTISSFEF